MEAVLLRKVRFRRGQLVLTVREGGFSGEAASFLCSGEERIPLSGKRKGNQVSFSLPPSLREGDWVFSEKVRLSGRARGDLLLWGPRRALPGGLLLFPLGGNGEELVLRCRKRTRYDGPLTWFRERLSFALSLPLRRMGVYRRSWVVFEKFCGQAQDNGAAFFAYCQEQFPKGKAGRVFFILDRHAPAYASMKKAYGRQVVPFMSLRHMLLMQLSPLYVASESRYHGYLFRCVPNPVFRNIRTGRHKIFFLQHGVTAQKRVDSVFGAKGYNPMDYMAATSLWEQRILTEHFGYPEERVPVTGFTRWDFWRDKRDPGRRYVLLCPTWRGYLDGKDEDFLRGSEFFAGYQALLSDAALRDLLLEFQMSLVFCLHPRLHEQGGAFSSPFSEVSLVPYDGKSLPGLLMGASLLITDYSSLAYDAAYLDRPVVFYRFDEERYNRETGGYVSAKKLPGPVARERGELYALLRQARERDFAPFVPGEKLFAHRDGKACERTAAFLEGEGFRL